MSDAKEKELTIKVEGLALGYGERSVLRGVSLEIEGGGVIALLGPNGSGKTTLLLAMCGLLRPLEGRVLVGGKDVARLKPFERARTIAILPQGLPSFIPFTVFDTVLMGRYPLSSPIFFHSRRDREATEKLLRATDLWHLKDRSCSALSGGEVQRVMLASVLAQETPVLLLDEPTASMDINQQRKIMVMILDMAAGQRKTVVVATHDLNLVAGTCERVAMIMESGEVRCGRTEEMLVEEKIARLFGVQVDSFGSGAKKYFIPRL
jgi:iron complex transport system ATP-binding protein